MCTAIGVFSLSAQGAAQATHRTTAKQRYYHADGYIKAIGKNAHRTIYSSNPRIRHKWQGALRYLIRVRHRAYLELHPAPRVSSVPDIICAVFGSACGKAQSVAYCESRYSTSAMNGQYYGIFQMGSHERATYGGSSSDAWDQVRAAHRYYDDAGWGPWQCA